jgi:hypothetical protein
MADNANSLIGFLKKKSLFSTSPTKNNLKKKEKSKDSRAEKEETYSYRKNYNDFEIDEPINLSARLLHKNS